MRKLSWLLTLFLAVSVINYPNPFNPKSGEVTTIECAADTTAEASLYIYDMAARMIAVKTFNLIGGIANRTSWNGYSDFNELAGNGIYLYQIIDKTKHRVAKGKIWIINH